MMKEEDIEQLREEFRKIDTDFSGTISASELEQAIRNIGKEVTANEISDIIKNVEFENEPTEGGAYNYLKYGRINYTEFLAATISAKKVITNEILWALFKHFDTDSK